MITENKQISEKEAWAKLSALCAKAEHCSGEIEEKLRLWGIEAEAKARIMARLTEEKYIDDERFVRSFVHDKMINNKWGRRKIEQALYQKRAPKDVALKILDEIPDDAYIAILKPLIKSKEKTVKARTDYERNMKLIRFAIGRGFGRNIIYRCIDHPDELPDD